MNTAVEQADLFGNPVVLDETPDPGTQPVAWLKNLGALTTGAQADQALVLLGVKVAPGQTRLQAWLEEMARRSGRTPAEMRRWVDTETNLLGNRSLAGFIWALA